MHAQQLLLCVRAQCVYLCVCRHASSTELDSSPAYAVENTKGALEPILLHGGCLSMASKAGISLLSSSKRAFGRHANLQMQSAKGIHTQTDTRRADTRSTRDPYADTHTHTHTRARTHTQSKALQDSAILTALY
jgi:hypothetical protein